jgi:hypothetical protein
LDLPITRTGFGARQPCLRRHVGTRTARLRTVRAMGRSSPTSTKSDNGAVRGLPPSSVLFVALLAACGQRGPEQTLKAELLEMLRVDQEVRERVVNAMRDIEPGAPPPAEWMDLVDEQNRIDEASARRLDEIVAEHGWPGRRLVGEEASHAASIILQHSTLERQKRYLPLLRAAAADGDLEPLRMAMLEDRIRVRDGAEQLYGTQIELVDGVPSLSPVAEPERLDERRRSVGLPPIEEYLRHVESELGRPVDRGSLGAH